MTKPNSTLIAIVLDRSGSMEFIRDATIEGTNAFLEQQKKQPGEAKLTLMQFDTEQLYTHHEAPLETVQPLSRETYVPRAGTALLDAIGTTIDTIGTSLAARAEEDRPSKVVVVIQTDGDENSSVNYTWDKINQMITHQQTKYQWDFVFLGANQDAIATAAKFGIKGNWAFTYTADALSMGKAMYAASSAVNFSRAGASNSYSAEVREAALDASTSLDSFQALVDSQQPGVQTTDNKTGGIVGTSSSSITGSTK